MTGTHPFTIFTDCNSAKKLFVCRQWTRIWRISDHGKNKEEKEEDQEGEEELVFVQLGTEMDD